MKMVFQYILPAGILGYGNFLALFLYVSEARPQATLSASDPLSSQLRNRLLMMDADSDGITDIEERQAGTDPDSPESRPLKRLGVWTFNEPTFVGNRGQIPQRLNHTKLTPGIDGSGLSLIPDKPGACFNLRGQESDGQFNLASNNGTIFLFFKPDWSSGGGPGQIAPLFSVGLWTADASYGYWGLTFSPDGRELFLGIQKDGTTQRFLVTPIDWKSGQWHHIRLTYSPSYAGLFIDGEKAQAQGAASIALTPNPKLLQKDGIDLLCDRYGLAHAKGTIDEIEIYNYGMGSNNVKARYNNLVSASASLSPPSITLNFPSLQNRPVKINKRPITDSKWTTLYKDFPGNSWTDTSIQSGEIYEYKIEPAFQHNHSSYWDRLVIASAGARTKDPQGILAVVVDQSLEPQIRPALEQANNAWIADGWRTKIILTPRHLDRNSHVENHANVLSLKRRLKDIHENSQNQLKSIVLIGHVPVPYSGRMNPDGHFFRPWEADLFYGDLVDDEKWTDRESDSPTQPSPRIPADGVMDPIKYPTPIEASVGRIDFANLDAFRQSEADLVAQYLKKSIRYRQNKLKFPRKSAGFSTFPHQSLSDSTYLSLTRNAGPIVGDSLASIFETNFLKIRDPYLFGVQLGAGDYDTISNGNEAHSVKSKDLARDPDFHRTAFMVLDGSYFGNWNTQNNFLRASLCVENGGLASMWGRHLMVRLYWLGAGLSIGESVINNVNSLNYLDGNAGFAANIYIQLMGDPTLTLFPQPPLISFKATKTPQGTLLEWSKADADPSPVFVEVSTTGIDGVFQPVSQEPIPENQILLPQAQSPQTIYRARRVVMIQTGSGLWTCLSHGLFAPAQ